MAAKTKISTGANDRPVDETIAQTGEGLPDDSSALPEVDERAVEEARKALGGRRAIERGSAVGNPEAVPAGTPGAGENICRRCAGSGKIAGEACPDCGGSGKVTTPVGGA